MSQTTFPSAHDIGDPVFVSIQNHQVSGHIRTVTFTQSKVRYAVSCPVVSMGDSDCDDRTTLHNLDSILVIAREGEKVDWGPDNYS